MLQSSSSSKPLLLDYHHHQRQQPIGVRFSCKLSRREFATTSLVLVSSQALLPPAVTAVEELDQCKNKKAEAAASRQAFLDFSIDGEAAGRITVGVDEDSAPLGATRFIELVSGRAGASYRRKAFSKVMPEYVQHGGVASLGLSNEALKREWEALDAAGSQCPGDFKAGSVALVVRDPSKPPPKPRLVARGGSLQLDQEEVGLEPNGTEFLICTRDAPALHHSALLIGTVLQGMDAVRRISVLPTVQENTASPYFRVAKLIGDKRAVVAERGFNRPYSKVLLTNCGLLQ